MSTAVVQQPAAESVIRATRPRELRLYSHSKMFYWWPVWAVGFVFALLTWINHNTFEMKVGDEVVGHMWVHPDKTVGVVYTFTFFLVILMTHFSVRGMASVVTIVTGIAIAFAFAYFDLWEPILRNLGILTIYMNIGFYLFFSTALFIVWFVSVFIFDRSTYYLIRPGQMVQVTMFGSGEQTFDTHGMSVEKKRDDLFRHWVLGLGSGDLHIVTTGAKAGDFIIPNVLFIGSKLELIQELVATQPNAMPNTVLTAGDPV